MRYNDTQSVGQLFSNMQGVKNIIDENVIKQPNPPTKEELWKVFKYTFFDMYGKHFIENAYTIKNIKVLFYYFLNDLEFFNCSNLIKGLNTPSFNKGLLIIGGVGIGKTDYFKVFERVFKFYNPLRFKVYSSKSLVSDYEKCSTPMEKEYFFSDKERKLLCIDDLGAENNASNYGIFDVVGNLLSNRYEKKLVTYATANFASSSNDVDETLEAMGVRYGHRIYDRLFEMFNVITFSGPSLRT
ncbi:DNA replication protein DnaC [Oceanihabitans sediminis]|uniref:ATPase n=1 Tax=Oceanihabitans sediminis TaxID=1812012 RepID=A0A368P517_9FLAO|nr:hypothetical protein [Oceanihabitans sediminis]RBP34233.1 DNA replication protein DnaC [Oceanihabitans sediminis]RCU57922.1 hypothetical protein DU428_00575 [Oceanihabitans sediminis]